MPWHLPEDLAHFKRDHPGLPRHHGPQDLGLAAAAVPAAARPPQHRGDARRRTGSADGAERAGSLEQALALCAEAAARVGHRRRRDLPRWRCRTPTWWRSPRSTRTSTAMRTRPSWARMERVRARIARLGHRPALFLHHYRKRPHENRHLERQLPHRPPAARARLAGRQPGRRAVPAGAQDDGRQVPAARCCRPPATHCAVFGQKTYNGVAILSRTPAARRA